MKRKLLSVTFLVMLCNISYAQNKQNLLKKIEEEKVKNEELFNKYQKLNAKNNKGSKVKEQDISTIAVATDEFIVHNRLTDNRANLASNVEALQNGSINGFSLNGENMELTIFDGGRVLSTHSEFIDLENTGQNRIIDLENGAQELSDHATSVAGFIAAEGAATLILTNNQTGQETILEQAAKGVLPKAKISSAGFNNVNGLNIFQKLLNFNKNITNHSYGTNVGWTLVDDETHPTGVALQFLLPSSLFTSSDQTLYGAYFENDYFYDLISYYFPKYTIVKSAGNEYGDGPNAYAFYNLKLLKSDDSEYKTGEMIPDDNCQTGAYCISFGSLAKNIIVVGSVDVSTASSYKFAEASQIVHSTYSSAGPRKDGAIKPDLVAVGTQVIAPTLNNSYIVGNGTSYSAPKVTGVVGAITQLKRLLTGDIEYNFDSDEVKAFLLHTTQEAGLFDGPDNKFGWGLLDGKKAAEVVLAAHNEEIIFEKNEKISGTNYEKLISANNDEELKITVTWIDPAVENFEETIQGLITDTSSKLVNDLDVRVIDTETNEEFLPWKLDLTNVTGAAIKGDNTVDNVEQISIKNPIVGRKYRVVVSNKRTLVNDEGAAANQDYSLLITGANAENLSTDELNKKSETLVYPTIAKDIVNVKTTEKIQKVDLIDLTGKLISTTKTDKVNVSYLSTGVYILKITTDKGITTKKIVKQ